MTSEEMGILRNRKNNELNSSLIYCCLVSALPVVVGLAGASAAGIGSYNDSPLWNFRIGIVGLSAGILAFCSGVHSYLFASTMSLIGASWLMGAYIQEKHPLIIFAGKELPVYNAFLLTAMMGVVFGMCLGAIKYSAYCCFAKAIPQPADLERLENIHEHLQRDLIGPVIWVNPSKSLYDSSV